MSNNPAKDFGEIASDYAFFEQHATEAYEDARAYQVHIATITPADRIVNMLDFGCGSGTFTVRFLEHTGWPPERLRLTLVEPAESVRRKAVARLGPLYHFAPYRIVSVAKHPRRTLRCRAGEPRLLLCAQS